MDLGRSGPRAAGGSGCVCHGFEQSAGNGRSFLKQHAPGVPWGAGAIGHAEWTGVPLRVILQEAGLKPSALEVMFEGHDRGTEPDHPEPMAFARSLPLAKALDPDTLLAVRMNGELLEPRHGAPLRLLVPGWYGVASVKWLRRIEVIDHPFRGYFQTTKYTVQRRTAHGLETVIVGPMAVKSEILRPRADEVLGLGTNRLFGVAWGGPEPVARVEVSTDAGHTWKDADLLGPRAAHSWTLWEYLWEVAEAGEYTLLVRARAADGQVQPLEHDPLSGGYQIHFSRSPPPVPRAQPAPAALRRSAQPTRGAADVRHERQGGGKYALSAGCRDGVQRGRRYLTCSPREGGLQIAALGSDNNLEVPF